MKQASLDVKMEVGEPPISAWVEQRGLLLCLPVPACRRIRLEQVAGFACKGKITRIVAATRRSGQDMVDLKGEVEDLLRRTTVFTSLPSALGYTWIKWVQDFANGRA